ncbi:MAG: thioesterase [Butyricicoccus sp.]|nr:thioesterase [Butyricicoccus sp.]
MYSFTQRVRYSETDGSGRLGIAGLLNYFQDCATFHSEDCGLGIEKLRARGMGWVLTGWQVVISRMPRFCEDVRIITNPYYIGGFLGKRNFLLETAGGERLAIANSVWTMVDPETGRPTHVAEDIGEKYGLGEPFEMDYAGRRIKLDGGQYSEHEAIPVARHMLDTNGHVNNTKYVSLAADLLPREFGYSQLRVEYKKSAVFGEVMYPKLYDFGGRYTVVLSDGEGKTCAATEFSR